MSPRKFLVLAKIESAQFTDAAPTAGANAILVKDMKVTPLKVTSEDRALVKPYYGNTEQIPVMEESMTEFAVEIAGSGSSPLGTAAAYGPLLRACGFAQTLNAGVSVVYSPISSGQESLTLWTYRDGLLYKMTGAMGSVKLQLDAKKLPHFMFSFTGKYVAVTDAAIASGAVYTGFIRPVASIPSFMGTVTFGGYAAKISSFNVDMANDIAHAIWMNQQTLQIVDRKPKGSMQVEMVTVATKDYWAQVRSAATAAAVVTQGNVAGNIVTVTAPAMQIADISESEFEKTMALTMSTVFVPNTGNDEIRITLT